MIRIVLFLLSLVGSLFVILYLDDIGHLVIFSGSQKIVVNLWFALAVLLLASMTIVWVYRFCSRFFRIHGFLKTYRIERAHQEKQHARTQALMYALCGNYDVAVGHMNIDREQPILSDMILYAVWLNKLQDLKQLDYIMGKIQASEKLPDGWMVWFRSFLLFERGKQDLACQVLLDAMESGLHSPQLIKAFAGFADPKSHYPQIMKYYELMSRYVPKEELAEIVQKGACHKMDQMIAKEEWGLLAVELKQLPGHILNRPKLLYYHARIALAQCKDGDVIDLMKGADLLQDNKLVSLLSLMSIPTDEKVKLVELLLQKYPSHKELLYMRSYLHAQEGDVVDTLKLLESAMAS